MKKNNLVKQISGKIICGFFALVMPIAAFGQGQTIVYGENGVTLKTDPYGWSTESLFPDSSRSYNSVTANDTMIQGFVLGGVAPDSVEQNRVFINNCIIGESVIGGFSKNSGAIENSVTMNGGRIRGDVSGGTSEGGTAIGNSVTINPGSINKDTVRGVVYGGYSEQNHATHNTVTINGGIIRVVYGGLANYIGDAVYNSVTVNDGTILMGIYGGYSDLGGASHNTVSINGGTVNADILGGMGSSGGDAKYNTVSISGNPTFEATAGIYGGDFGNDNFTGNKLELKTAGISVNVVQNFEFINFYLPSTIADGDTVITLAMATDLSNVTIGLDFASTDPSLAMGDVITLISSVTNRPDNDSTVFNIEQYAFLISVDGGALIATVIGVIPVYTVSFAGNVSIAPQRVFTGNLVIKPANPVRSGYSFEGWYTDNNTFANAWNFATDKVTQDTTLYAKWNPEVGIVEANGIRPNIKVYPNPTNGELRIENGEFSSIENGEIYDVLGRRQKAESRKGENTVIIDISHLASGVYYLKIDNKTVKVIKN